MTKIARECEYMLDIQNESQILTAIIYGLAYTIDPLIWIIAFSKMLKPKYERKIYYFLSWLGMYAIIWGKQILVLNLNSNLSAFFFPVMLGYIILVSKVMFEGGLKKRLGTFIGVYTLSMITDVICALIMMCLHMPFNMVTTYGRAGSISILLIRIVNLLLFIVIIKFLELRQGINKRVSVVISYREVIGLLIIISLIFGQLSNNLSALYCIGTTSVIFSMIITAYMIALFRNQERREQEAIERAKQYETRLNLFEYTKETYEEIKAIRHDMKRHYQYILELSHLQEYKKIEEYVLELYEDLQITENCYLCDNLVIAVALFDAQRRANAEGIHFTKTITVNQFPFSEAELNSVMSNILDNAFEAVSKVSDGEKNVKIEIKKINKKQIMFFCTNTYNKEAYLHNPFLLTIKADRSNHGYGTRIIKKIVKRHSGDVVYWKDDKNFYVKIIVKGDECNEDTLV